MSFSNRQTGTIKNLRDGSALPKPGQFCGVDMRMITPQRVRVNACSDAVITITAANDYGSLHLLEWQDSNIHILGLESNLTLTKGNTATGIVAATDLSVGMGSAAASSATLAGVMVNYMEAQSLTDDELAPVLAVNVLGQTTATYPWQLADAAANRIYLNVSTIAGVTVDDTITVSGWVDVTFIDLGNNI